MRTRAAIHFAGLGAVLWLLATLFGAAPLDRSASLAALSDDDLLYAAALARGLDRDDPVVRARLVNNMRFLIGADADPDTLYGHALELRMGDGDVVVRRRLVERMRTLLREPAVSAEPSDAELQAYLDAHAEEFAAPSRVRLRQKFLRPHRSDSELHALPLPAHLPSSSQADLVRLFGSDFAAAVFSLPTGGWHGPITSSYGQHLVWIDERQPAQALPLATVRGQVRAAVLEERASTALHEALAALRAQNAS